MLTKKISFMALALTLGASSPVFASHTPKNKAYVGADVQYAYLESETLVTTLDGNVFKPQENKAGVSLFAGYRFNLLGLELGLTGYNQHTTSGNFGAPGIAVAPRTVKQQNYNIYLDGVYFYKLIGNLDLKALVGLGVLSSKFTTTAPLKANLANNSRAGVRFGLGCEYYFTENISSSLMYKFQTGNKYVKSVQTVALGVAYKAA